MIGKEGMEEWRVKGFRIKAKMKGYLPSNKKSIFDTPIIINNYNRLEYLKDLIAWLESAGMKKIYIIDNLSTYPPLLEFYKKIKYTVFKLDKNYVYHHCSKYLRILKEMALL